MAHDTRNPTQITEDERSRLLRLAYRLCWNAHDAEEALQAGLLAATRKSDQLRDRTRRWSWLCRVVVQHCHLLARDRRPRPVDSAILDQHVDRAAAAPDTAELGGMMRDLVQLLPTQQCAAVALRHLEGMDYADIAVVLGVAESTARAHVRAGREGLRKMILQRYPEWSP